MTDHRSPDPVAEPKAYQDHLLGLLGTDDPAEVQAGTPARLRALVETAGPDLRSRPEPAEWSALECLAHIVDAEVVMSGRYRFILAHDEPVIMGYDQDRWVGRLHHWDERAEPLLDLFEALRSANLSLWEGSSQRERDRIGMHQERGSESFELSFRMLAGHDRFHTAQAERALAMVRAPSG
jgi:DinB superfamily